jgi:starch phosphorylase
MKKQDAGEFRNSYRTGNRTAEVRQAILDHLHYTQGRRVGLATRNDWYMAVAHAVRDRMLEDWLQSLGHMRRSDVKVVGYLSAEFLMGPHWGTTGEPRTSRSGKPSPTWGDLERFCARGGAGAGGTAAGALAACYLDSLATLRVPAVATVSDTMSASSTRRFATGQERSPTSGSASATRGRSAGRRSPTT